MLDAIVDRSAIDPALIDDVIMGCVTQAGEQAMEVGRAAVLASKLPQTVPAVTIDRQCGSSQQAVQFAAQAVMSGTQNVLIAAGVESAPISDKIKRSFRIGAIQPVRRRRDDGRQVRLQA